MKEIIGILLLACLFISCRGDIWGRMPANANFKMLNDGCEAPCKVTFINTSTGNGNSYNWFFPTSSSTEENVEQIFNLPGTYQVTLNATNGTTFSSFSQNVTINQPKIKPLVAFQMQYPNFSFVDEAACEYPCQVNFVNETLGYNANYLWDFGDGETSTQMNPIHTYYVSGTYNVSLTATNDYGTSTGTQAIYVLPYFNKAKVLSISVNSLMDNLLWYDKGEPEPNQYPDLYLFVRDQNTWQVVNQNRDLNVLQNVQNLPILIENKDAQDLSYLNPYQVGVADKDEGSTFEYDPVGISLFFNPQTFAPFIKKVTYPDNTQHWIAEVPLNNFSPVSGTITIEYFE